tara:strand:+ start:376 stop:999 length:624 start_codon:yes stop_codon:yes gene_type:complete
MAANGGMSFSNNFVVKFLNPPVGLPVDEDYFEMFCSEAQLPNTNTAQGNQNGLYLGSGQTSYAHTRVFTEIQLGFMCDANMSALKFLQNWNDFIFSEGGDEVAGQDLRSVQGNTGSSVRGRNRSIKLQYKDDYSSTILISKTDLGGNSPVERTPITYVLEEAYPYAIDAIPLQFGSSQLTQVTAQFSYSKHYTVQNDIRGMGARIVN